MTASSRCTTLRVVVARWVSFLLAVVLCAALLLWLRNTERAESAESAGGALSFEYAGCASVRQGPVCVLAETRALTLWVAGEQPLQVLALGELLAAEETKAVGGGQQHKLRVPERATELHLQLGPQRGRLLLAEDSTPAVLKQAKLLRQQGQWQQARELLIAREPELQPQERNRARALLARLALSEGQAKFAAAELAQTWRLALSDGLLSEAAEDLLAAVYVHSVQLRDYSQARALLQEAAGSFSDLPSAQAQLPYFEGLLSLRVADPRSALLQFRQAVLRARRLGLSADEVVAQQELTRALMNLGRNDEALKEQRVLLEGPGPGANCTRVAALGNLAWLQLTTPGQLDSTEATLQRAGEALKLCPNPTSTYNHQLNLVYASLRRGNLDAAEQRLRELGQGQAPPSARLAAWEADFQGELRWARGQSEECTAAFDRARRLAESAGLSEQAYRAWLGQGRCHALAGRTTQAREAYQTAEALADELVRGIPFGEGQQLFALDREQSARLLLSLELQEGNVAQAFRVARHARERLLAVDWRPDRIANLDPATRLEWERAIAEYHQRLSELEAQTKDDWKLSGEGLESAQVARQVSAQLVRNALAKAYAVLPRPHGTSQPALSLSPLNAARGGAQAAEGAECVSAAAKSGQATLLVARGHEAWFAFLCAPTGLTVTRLLDIAEDRDERSLSAEYLVALQGKLAQTIEHWEVAQRLRETRLLRVAMHPLLQRMDVHALGVQGAPLGARYAVAYVLDTDSNELASDAKELEALRSGAGNRVLIISDPNLDLPLARAEAEQMGQVFSGAAVLVGEQASEANVTTALGHSGLLHFAGHAEYGGVDGVDSTLKLFSSDRLELGEVLSLQAVPHYVVLSACEAAGSAQQDSGGLSIGQAFLAAGARVVIAPSRTVADRAGYLFTLTLYRNLHGLNASDWGFAVRHAWEDLRKQVPDTDWASFRLLVP